MTIGKPDSLKRMQDSLFAKIAAALVAAGSEEEEAIDTCLALDKAKIRTEAAFRAATDDDLAHAQVPRGDIIALRPLRTATGAPKRVDPNSLGDEELLTAFNEDEGARKGDDFVRAARERFPFVFVRRAGDKATICVAELVSYLAQNKERPRGRTWNKMTVTTIDRLVDRTRRVSPFNGDVLVDGTDPDGDAWEFGDLTVAFVRFARTRMASPPQADKHMYLDGLAEADGDYAKLKGNRWRRAIEEFDAAREEDPGLVKALLAELVKRDSVPAAPAATVPPTGSQTSPRPNDLLSDLTGVERKAFLQALLAAFPRWDDLSHVFTYELDMKLEELVMRDALLTAYPKVIEKAMAGGWAHRLLTCARKTKPGNDTLRNFEATIMANRQPPPAPPQRFFVDGAALQRKLREVGARLYEDPTAAKVVASNAGLRNSPIDFHQGPESFWFEMVEEAVKSHKLIRLVETMREGYSNMDLNMIADEAPLHGLA